MLVTPLSDGRTWIIVSPFSYEVREGETIIVPSGFKTDFASVPRPFWWIIPQWGKYGSAAVVHDLLYQTGIRKRKEADTIFLQAMKESNVGWLTRYIMYWAVRAFGYFAYRRH